jgi:hypothetical protein
MKKEEEEEEFLKKENKINYSIFFSLLGGYMLKGRSQLTS